MKFSVNTLKQAVVAGLLCSGLATATYAQEAPTRLLWGDTHLHTSLSGDAFGVKNETADPDTAYRFAKGLPVIHPYHRSRVQISAPLDFLAVTDHAEYMGVFQLIAAKDQLLKNTVLGQELLAMMEQGQGKQVFYKLAKSVNEGKPFDFLVDDEIRQPIWNKIVDAAERHNEPGKFTTFIGWEWSSLPQGDNLHRVVLMRDSGEQARQFLPYSLFDSEKPEDLWQFLERTTEKTGTDFLAIPHNPNISNGRMFATVDSDGRALTAAYASERMKWEPVVEMTQVKGDSETHPVLSPGDEFADFESYQHLMKFGSQVSSEAKAADYARSALLSGLQIEAKTGENPFKFGMIGSSDMHSGLSDVAEDNFMGKFALDSTPETKHIELTPGAEGIDMSASGLAAVWATDNTREAIFAAMKRKEVYATTGSRIQVRFFAGWDFDASDVEARDFVERGYRKGVPMGGDLTAAPQGKAPELLIWAAQDPRGASLDRLQVVKGWLDSEGQSHEKVFNVAASGGRVIRDNKLTALANTVDLATGKYDKTTGAAQLSVVWQDPEFDANTRAFYYVRVLEIPTPRHTLYDALALKEAVTDKKKFTIQERAYTSPVWYTP